MKTRSWGLFWAAVFCLPFVALLLGCKKEGNENSSAGAPPPAQVEQETNPSNFKVPHPEQFTLVAAEERKVVPALNVTGVIQPDIARAVPVLSIATGQVVEIDTRLGDEVKKGQLLLKVRSGDITAAYQTYLKAANDEHLARLQLDREKILYERGAVAKSVLEQAEDTEQDGAVDLKAAAEQLRLLGADKDHPSPIVEIKAPISGVITDQQVTNAAGVQGLPGPNPFTISDLSYVWVMCDVYENDLDAVHVGEYADIHLNAYPNKPSFKARIDNIFPILDPNIRTAKVRLEVPNPGRLMRVGMFVSATFYGKQAQLRAEVPSTAVLHLHDRDWVFTPLGGGKFRRVEVVAGDTLPNGKQEIISGLKSGDQVVQSALMFENAAEQ